MINIRRTLIVEFKGVLLMILSALCTATGQLSWKFSAIVENGMLIYLAIGFTLYIFGALLMIFAFRFGKLSVLHPMMCLSYVFALFYGAFFLEEIITIKKIIGVTAIISGVIVLGGGND